MDTATVRAWMQKTALDPLLFNLEPRFNLDTELAARWKDNRQGKNGNAFQPALYRSSLVESGQLYMEHTRLE